MIDWLYVLRIVISLPYYVNFSLREARSMRRRRRQAQMTRISPQESKVYFSLQTQMNLECGICLRSSNSLLKPCECNIAYHEHCLLLFIRKRIIQQLRQRQQMDLTTLKCSTCNHRFFITFRHEVHQNCQNLCKRLSTDCCNNYIIFLCVLLVIIIITVAIAVYFVVDKKTKITEGEKYGLISALIGEGLIFLAVLYSFFDKYMTIKLFILEKVLEMIDVRSVSSQNSDEYKVNEEEEVVIQE